MVGLSELVVVVVVALAILRPDKLAEYTKNLKGAMQAARDMQEDAIGLVKDGKEAAGVEEAAASVREGVEEMKKQADELKGEFKL